MRAVFAVCLYSLCALRRLRLRFVRTLRVLIPFYENRCPVGNSGAGDGVAAAALLRFSMSAVFRFVLFWLFALRRFRLRFVRTLRVLIPSIGKSCPVGKLWSGRRDSDPRLSPWQGDTLPLSHSRKIFALIIYQTNFILATVFYQYVRFCNLSAKSISCVGFGKSLAAFIASFAKSFILLWAAFALSKVKIDVSFLPLSSRSSVN